MSTITVLPDAPQRTPLPSAALRHPSEYSRMLLAVSTTAATLGGYVVGVASLGGLVTLALVSAAVAAFLASIWLGLQLYRAQLLGRSIRVTETSLPELQALVDDVRAQLDYHRSVDVYITQKVAPSVSTTSYFGTKVIVVEGGLIGDLVGEQRAQLTFLLARSFGALKARHDRLAVVLPLLDGLRLLPWIAVFLLPYFRASTYSGDQAGLACCGSLDTALTATERLLVGKEVAPRLRARGVVSQAETVRRRWLPRLIQLLLAEPHLTNRYANLVLFCARHDPAALDAFRGSLDDASRSSLDALARRSPHRHPPRSRARRAALAAVFAALTAGYLAAIALSAGDAQDATPAAASASSGATASGATDGARELLGHVPATIRATCATAGSAAPAGAVESLRCDGGGVDVVYSRFASAAALDAAFDAASAGAAGDANGDCATGDFLGRWELGGADAGRLLCSQTDGATILWTHDELLIGAAMFGDDVAALHAAWLDAGPE